MQSQKRVKDEVALGALLRVAGNTYATAMRDALAAEGFDDLPRDGVFFLGAIRGANTSLSDVIRWLGSSKQSVGQLVDTLVLRGYVHRDVDEQDRRRLKITLTERGEQVAAIARRVTRSIDEKLLQAVGAAHVDCTRATLKALMAQSEPK